MEPHSPMYAKPHKIWAHSSILGSKTEASTPSNKPSLSRASRAGPTDCFLLFAMVLFRTSPKVGSVAFRTSPKVRSVFFWNSKDHQVWTSRLCCECLLASEELWERNPLQKLNLDWSKLKYFSEYLFSMLKLRSHCCRYTSNSSKLVTFNTCSQQAYRIHNR